MVVGRVGAPEVLGWRAGGGGDGEKPATDSNCCRGPFVVMLVTEAGWHGGIRTAPSSRPGEQDILTCR